jgi:glycosyltransferase involved in cell wall biosynthesis
MKPAIHQLVAGFSNGDAISNEARLWRAIFRGWGHPSDIFCETKRILPELRKDARDLTEAAAALGPDDIVILHLSIGSDANLVFRSLRARKVILYHNITPPDFFRGYHEEIRAQLARGREQLAALRDTAEVNLAVSRFNATELEQAGFRDVGVVPLVIDRSHWTGPADRRVIQQYRGDGMINLLFVGRLVPNKRIEDLLFTLYYCQRYTNPNTRLIHVGSPAGLERYQALLRTKAMELKLNHLVFAGSVRPDELRAYYQSADLFLCLSEHEGFCIPLLEAMGHRLPVVAFDAGAVAETLDGAGVLVREKRFDLLAELIHRLTTDPALRAAVVAGQDTRLARFEQTDIPALLRDRLAPLGISA